MSYNEFGIVDSKQPVNYDPLALDYFTRAGISDTTEKRAVNTFVLSCKTNSNIWASLQGGFVYLVSPTSYVASLNNLLSSSFSASPGTSPTFSQTGWSFNTGASQYLKTGFVPSVRMTINTGFTAMKIRSHVGASVITGGASDAGGTTQWQTSVRNLSNLATFNAYNAATSFTGSNDNNTGTYVYSITANNNRFIRRNGSSVATSSATVAGSLPAIELYIGGRNLAGALGSPATFETCTWIQGLIGLSTTDADALATIIDTYNSTVISGGR